jgi:hypothetical protein
LVTAIVHVTADPAFAEAGPIFVISRSACGLAVPVDVALLLAGFGSVVEVLTAAVLEIVVPLARLLGVCRTIENVALAPLTNVVVVQLTVPVAPTAGVVHVKGDPAFCVSETKVVPAGRGSTIETLCASLGPLFVTTIVYE